MLKNTKQAHLKRPGESLQIKYPSNYTGQKYSDIEADEFYVGSEPMFLTVGEIALAQAFIAKLAYRQELILTGAILVDPADPLFLMTDEELDEVEETLGLDSSRDPSGAEGSLRERVYRIREAEPDRPVESILRKAIAPTEAINPAIDDKKAVAPSVVETPLTPEEPPVGSPE